MYMQVMIFGFYAVTVVVGGFFIINLFLAVLFQACACASSSCMCMCIFQACACASSSCMCMCIFFVHVHVHMYVHIHPHMHGDISWALTSFGSYMDGFMHFLP